MFTLSSWTQVQDLLLSDPAYAGMMPGDAPGQVTIVWRPNIHPGPAAHEAVQLLQSLGVDPKQKTNAGAPNEMAAEQARLIGFKSDWLQVYVVGPNSTEDRLDVTVAIGSFTQANLHDTDVLTQLAPRIPITIVENQRPRPAGLTMPGMKLPAGG